jgi:hypothetical protein
LPHLLQDVYEQLRFTGESFVQIDASNYLALKFFLPFTYPPDINDYDIPMLLFDKFALSSLPWDLTLRHLLPYIDGTSNVKKIAVQVDMDVDRVKRGIRLLFHYQCLIIGDTFKFSNVYELLPHGINELGMKQSSRESLEKALCFCIKSSGRDKLFSEDSNRSSTMKTKYFDLLIMLLSIFKNRKRLSNLKDEFSRLPEEIQDINIRRLIAISCHLGWIRRVHEYPCYTLPRKQPPSATNPTHTQAPTNLRSSQSSVSMESQASIGGRSLKRASSSRSQTSPIRSHSVSDDSLEIIHRYATNKIESLSGGRCLDDLCCEYNLKAHDVLDYPGILVIYK